MDEELKQTLIGLSFFLLLSAGAWFLFGRDIRPDLSTDFDNTSEHYYEGGVAEDIRYGSNRSTIIKYE